MKGLGATIGAGMGLIIRFFQLFLELTLPDGSEQLMNIPIINATSDVTFQASVHGSLVWLAITVILMILFAVIGELVFSYFS